MRRFTRLTNAFSKRDLTHYHMVALYTVWYNSVRMHKTLRVTAAVAAGVSDRLWEMADVVAVIGAKSRARSRGLRMPHVVNFFALLRVTHNVSR